jgi:c-di-GMP-related signal transduction protein
MEVGPHSLHIFADMPAVDLFVARQAIFDRLRRLHAYELLFCASGAPQDETLAAQLLANALLTVGLDAVAGGAPVFLKLGRESLLQNWPEALPRESTIIEVSSLTDADAELAEACRKLRRRGYRIATTLASSAGIEITDIVKIDVHSAPWREQRELVKKFHQEQIQILATKVESYEEFERAHEAAYDYFQGLFFTRPVVLRSRQIPPSAAHCFRLLREAQQPELDMLRLEAVIGQDLSFSYTLLLFVNSALHGRRKEIRSIRHALLFLGEEDVRRWIALAALPALAQDKPPELVFHSVVRGAFCQAVSRLAHASAGQQAFLMGMFSLIDAIMDRPMAMMLSETGLAPEIAGVLLGSAFGDRSLSLIYDLARAYEAADWQAVYPLCEDLVIAPKEVTQAYLEATRWARDILIRPVSAQRSPAPTPRYPRESARPSTR